MNLAQDPFVALTRETPADDFKNLAQRSVSSGSGTRLLERGLSPVVARLHSFDLLGQPVLSELPACSGQLKVARTTVPMRREMVGHDVVVLFDDEAQGTPIIIGIIEPAWSIASGSPADPGVTIHVDGERRLIEAEREIVLRCGDASITLTRAGKVIIKGNYILSRSTGYNKIKGAAIDIN